MRSGVSLAETYEFIRWISEQKCNCQETEIDKEKNVHIGKCMIGKAKKALNQKIKDKYGN